MRSLLAAMVSATASAAIVALAGLAAPAAVLAQTTTALPSSIVLTATIRDFPSFNPDFESPADWCKEIRGLYRQKLDPVSGKPVFVPPAQRGNASPFLTTPNIDCNNCYGQYGFGTGIFMTAACPNISSTLYVSSRNAVANYGKRAASEYFRNVPLVNVKYEVPITIYRIGNSTLYESNPNVATSFFPLDNIGAWGRNGIAPTANGDSHNFWFTTEISTKFFYRGGEVFSFAGDDDLAVFIDGTLTSCDLSSIHNLDICNITIDSLGFTLNTQHTLSIFHAERHRDSSNFKFTTSILPIDNPPVAIDQTVTLPQGSSAMITLTGTDPDIADRPNLVYYVTKLPKFGNLTQATAATNAALVNNTATQSFTYTPSPNFFGNDSIMFLVNDGQTNSTVTGRINVLVTPVFYPPVAFNITVETTTGTTVQVQLNAKSLDTVANMLTYARNGGGTKFGTATLDTATGLLSYSAINVGVDYIPYLVISNVSNLQSNTAFVIVKITSGGNGGTGFTPGQLGGIIAGSVAGATLIAAGASMAIYRRYAAKYALEWEAEFNASNIKTNPLFVPRTIEAENALYVGKGA